MLCKALMAPSILSSELWSEFGYNTIKWKFENFYNSEFCWSDLYENQFSEYNSSLMMITLYSKATYEKTNNSNLWNKKEYLSVFDSINYKNRSTSLEIVFNCCTSCNNNQIARSDSSRCNWGRARLRQRYAGHIFTYYKCTGNIISSSLE